MGEPTTLVPHVDTYELTDMLPGARPDVLILVGESLATGEMVLERVAIRRCDAGMLN